MKLDNERTAVQCIDHESMICVRESLLNQGKEIIHAGTVHDYPDVHGKIEKEFVVVFKER